MKSIQVSPDVKKRVKELAVKNKTTQAKIIEEAIILLEKIANLEDSSELDRISWYIIKLAMSVGHFKEYPDKLNYNQLKYTAKQIQERLGVDTSKLLVLAEEYMRKQDKETKIRLNEALKEIVKKMILLLFK